MISYPALYGLCCYDNRESFQAGSAKPCMA